MYSGFELCENAALPGREEYLDSEKYELKAPRLLTGPGNITREITQLNAVRNAEPVFRSHFGIAFLNAFNDNILYFSKAERGRRLPGLGGDQSGSPSDPGLQL